MDGLPMQAVQSRLAVGGLALLLCLLPLSGSEAGRLYRWVDEDGNVHFTDTMPATATEERHSVMDTAGNLIEDRAALETERALRAEEEARQAEAEARARELERIREEQRRRDRIITQTFSTERDIRMTREDRLEAIEAQIRNLDRAIGHLQDEREWEVRQVRKQLLKSEPVDGDLARLDEIDTRLYRRLQQRRSLVAKRDRVDRKFAYYLERFRELTGGR